jgi:PAS domain S-box-containing protein
MSDEKKTKDQLIDELAGMRQRLTALEALETERMRAEEALHQKTAFVQLLQQVAVAANEAATMKEVLQYALDQVCAHTGWPVGDVYLLADHGRDELVPTGIWHLKNPKQFETFRRVTDATSFARGVGLPGRVLASGKPAWIIDVTQDPNFPRAKLAQDIGVKAGFAFPVLVGTEVVAVLEFFSAEAIEPDEPLLDMMAQVGTQLGRVIERTRAEEALQRAKDDLEVRVQERTAELTVANEDLRREMEARTRAKEALRQAEEKYRSIFENAVEGIFQTTPEGRYLSANSSLALIYGYATPQEMIETLTDIGPQLYVDPTRRDEFVRLLQEQSIVSGLESQVYRKDGSVIWISENARAVRDPSGALLYYEGTVEDISARKQAEEALLAANVEIQETRQYLERLIESSTDAIISTDKGGTLVLFNKGAEAMLGYRAEEMIGRRVTVLYESEERAKEVMRQMRKQSGTVSAFETALRAKDGSSIPVLISASTLYDEDGQEAGTVGFNKDLRPLKQAEEELRRAKAQIQALRIEIDQPKRARQVSEITDTEYFQDLQKKAKSLRDRSKTG